MFEGVQLRTEMMAYFIEKNGNKHGNMKVESNWWNVINSDKDVKCAGSLIVNHLLTLWQIMLDFVEWASATRKGICQFITNGGFGDIKVVELGR